MLLITVVSLEIRISKKKCWKFKSISVTMNIQLCRYTSMITFFLHSVHKYLLLVMYRRATALCCAASFILVLYLFSSNDAHWKVLFKIRHHMTTSHLVSWPKVKVHRLDIIDITELFESRQYFFLTYELGPLLEAVWSIQRRNQSLVVVFPLIAYYEDYWCHFQISFFCFLTWKG